jgi:hypothetical protein
MACIDDCEILCVRGGETLFCVYIAPQAKEKEDVAEANRKVHDPACLALHLLSLFSSSGQTKHCIVWTYCDILYLLDLLRDKYPLYRLDLFLDNHTIAHTHTHTHGPAVSTSSSSFNVLLVYIV